MKVAEILGWVAGLVALFLVLYYYVGTQAVANSVFSGVGNLAGRLQGRDQYGNLPNSYPYAS